MEFIMQYKIYTIYDSKVGAYLPPLFFKSKGEFMRAFQEAANDSKSNIGKYPADFIGFELGTFDDSNCAFELHKAPVSLGVAIEFVIEPVKSV